VTRARRVASWTLGILVGLVLLYFLFEWAGNFLDSGGTVGL
jgi:hypothetical protein